MAAVMILSALLLVSVILTVVAWISRANQIALLNDLQERYDKKKTQAVQEIRDAHHKDVRMQTGAATNCVRCTQLLRERNGYNAELRKAYGIMTQKQKDEMHYNYDIVAKNVVLKYVSDPKNSNLELLQISFTVKNQSGQPRGNMLGLFKLYNGKDQIWQKEFNVQTLLPGKSTEVRIMAPGSIDWDGWFCNIYPSTP